MRDVDIRRIIWYVTDNVIERHNDFSAVTIMISTFFTEYYDQFSIGFLINCFYFKVEFADLGPPRRIYHLFCLPLRVAVYIIHSHYFFLFFLLSISCIYSLNNLLVNQKSNWLEASLSGVNFPNKNTFRHIAIMLCNLNYFIQCDDSIIHLL